MSFSKQISSRSFNTSPTILQVIPSLKSGGVEIGTIEIGKAIVKAGGKSIIALRLDSPAKTLEHKEGIELINLPLDTKNPFLMIMNVKHLKDLIQNKKIDIVHVRSRAPAWSAYIACRSLGIPFITTYHAAYSSRTIFKTLYNSVMAKGKRVIAISQFIQNHLIEKYGTYSWFEASNIRLIERGIDLDYFDPASISSEHVQKLRKSWGITPDTRLLLLPGRISKTKGQDLLIKALAMTKDKNVKAIFIGSAEGHEAYRDKLLRFAASLHLEDRVKWVAPPSDIAIAYKAADIIICPSLLPEGFGRIMAEAQAMEKPIISASHGASCEIIEDTVTGWLIPPKDANALAKTIDMALNLSQKTLTEIGKKGRERVKVLFSNEVMTSKTIDVYKEILVNE